MLDDLYSEPVPVAQQQIHGGKLVPVRTRRALPNMAVPIAKPKVLGPETSWSFFHPGRVDARRAPADFRSQVHAIDPNLDVVWHAVHERWCVWVRNPRIRFWMCPGWQMLFVVRYADGSYMPLDTRTLATIFDRSPRKWGNARQYFDRLEAEMHAERRRKKAAHSNEIGAIAREKFDSCQISVSMRGASNGSKFQKHHSGN